MNLIGPDPSAVVSARRILVLGSSGCGKSTLSRRLSELLDIPHVSMDREFFWLPGWKLRERAEIRDLLSEAVKAESWIIDGNSARTLDLRLPRAQLVIWLRLPRLVCIWQALRRWWMFRGQTRPEMADGCPEKMDLEFLRYIWTFEQEQTPEIEQMIARYGADVPVMVLRKRADLNQLLARLEVAV